MQVFLSAQRLFIQEQSYENFRFMSVGLAMSDTFRYVLFGLIKAKGMQFFAFLFSTQMS